MTWIAPNDTRAESCYRHVAYPEFLNARKDSVAWIGPLTYIDAALLAVALLSGLLAMYRGLTREVLSIVSWGVAAAAVLYFVVYHKREADALAKQLGVNLTVAG